MKKICTAIIVVTIVLFSMCYFSRVRATDITELTGITGYVGNEDISWGTGQATDTFSVVTSTGGAVSLTKVPGLTSYQESILKGAWYPSNSSSVTDHGNSGVQGSLAWTIATIGSTTQSQMVIPSGNYTIEQAITVPANITLHFSAGAVLSLGSGDVLTLNSPNQIQAPTNQQIFSGTGTVVFTNPGTVQAAWWGTGGTVLSIIYNSVADGSVVLFTNDLTITNGVDLTTKTVSFEGLPSGTTTITSSGDYVFRYSNKSANHENFFVRNLSMVGGSAGTDGLVIRDADMARIENVQATGFTNAGFVVDNDPTPGATHTYIASIEFDNCKSGGNYYGFLFHGGPEETAYQLIKITNSLAYGNSIGIYAYGNNKSSKFLTIADNILVEANAVEGVKLRNGAILNCTACYLEQTDESGYIDYSADNGTMASFKGSLVGIMPGDSNSTTTDTIVENSYINALGWSVGPSRLGRGTDSTCIGPAYFRTMNIENCTETQSGTRIAKGQIWVDSSYNTWRASADGTSGGVGWDIVGGHLTIPISYADINGHSNYSYSWVCFETPTLVNDVHFVVTETFSGGTGTKLKIGSSADYKEVWISDNQTEGNLTAGKVISGIYNDSDSAYLTGDGGSTARGKYLSGHTHSEVYTWIINGTIDGNATDCAIVYPYDSAGGWGTWTQGKGYLVFDVVPLKN